MGCVWSGRVVTGVVAVVTTMGGIRVTVSPPSATGAMTGGGGTFERVNTEVVSMVIVPPGSYPYSWVHVSGDVFVVYAPGSSSTAFGYDLTLDTVASGYYKARVSIGGADFDSEPFFVQCARYS